MTEVWRNSDDGFDISDEDEEEGSIDNRSRHDPLSSQGGSNAPLMGGEGNESQTQFHSERRGSYKRKEPYEDMTAIDWSNEFSKQREYKEYLKEQGLWTRLMGSSHQWLVLLMTGLSIGVLAAMIDVVSQWLSGLKFGHCSGAFYLSRESCCINVDQGAKCERWVSWADSMGIKLRFFQYTTAWVIYTVLAVSFATLASYMTYNYARFAKMSGMPEIKTIVGGYVIKGFFGYKTLAVKSIGICLVVGAGLWVGKEGPLVHLACCCANLAMRPFTDLRSNEATKREVLSAATAAGISVAFNAPIGGVLFTLEQVVYYANDRIMWHSFVCAMTAAVTLQTLNPHRSGRLILFEVALDRNWHHFELVAFVVIGIFGGLFGTALIRLNHIFANWRNSVELIRKYPVLEVATLTLVSAVLCFPDIYMRLHSEVLLSYLFEECTENTLGHLCEVEHWFSTIVLLLLAAIIGLVLTAYSFGTFIPAGILMPTMLIGAIGGRSIGVMMQNMHTKWPDALIFSACPTDGRCITPGVYALVGAASALTGATRVTVSSVVIMFEQTGALIYVLPIMTGVMISKWVGDWFGRMSIYESWVQMLGYPLINKLDEDIVPEVDATAVMTKDVKCIGGDMTVEQVLTMVKDSVYAGYPIVQSMNDKVLLGWISRRELVSALTEKPRNEMVIQFYREIADTSPITANSSASFHHVSNLFQSLGLPVLLITEKGRLSGLLTKKDVWRLLSTPVGRAQLYDISHQTNV